MRGMRRSSGQLGKQVTGYEGRVAKLCCGCAARLPSIGESKVTEGLLLVMSLAMDWIGEERARRTMGSPKGWRRAEVWMRTAKWDGGMTQDWKEAVSRCTGISEGTDDEDQWEVDVKDERWELLERYKTGKGKLVEGCYGPEPAGIWNLEFGIY